MRERTEMSASPDKLTELIDSREEGKSRLRILIVAPSFDILGGQAMQAARLFQGLSAEESLSVGFLAINPRLPGSLRKLQAIKYVRTVVTSILYVASLLARVPHYDVIHIFSASYFSFVLAPTPAMLVSKLFGKKIVLNYHSGEAEDHLARWPSAVRTLRLAHTIAVPSEYLVQIFAKFGLRACAIVNTIDGFSFRRRKPAGKLLSNRNFESHYGVDRVLRAFAIIHEQCPKAELTVAGDGPQRADLEQLASELQLQNVEFIGRVPPDRIAKLYDSADVFLNGSEIDNQPLSILEAFACGLPVVTTNAGGIPFMVNHEETGLMVECGDYQGLAREALRLLNDESLVSRITDAAHEESQKYRWNGVRGQWLAMFHSVARGEPLPSVATNDSAPPLGSDGSEPSTIADRTELSVDCNAPARAGRLARLKRFRSMSVDEVRVRGLQAANAVAERRGWSSLLTLPAAGDLARLTVQPYEGTFLLRFRTRQTPNFFAAFADREQTLFDLRSRWPDTEWQIVSKADRICEGRFDLLGFKGLSFGDPVDWHYEPVAGKRVPLDHWSRLNYLDPEVAGDKKIIWELNRHQYFSTLGQAYWLTGDERYAETFVAHLESWMDANPPKMGINWASSLEVAFRSISWLWAFYFFKDSTALTEELFSRALGFLHVHGRHLESYLSTYFSPNTHLTGEALGLFYLGTLLPEFKRASRWQQKGAQILINQLDRHVQPDGVYFEQSSYYHRYTTDFYTHFLLLARMNDYQTPEVLEIKLKSLLDHLMYISRPDGSTPLFGDDDGGRLTMLDVRAANDFRAALSTGAALFGRGDYKYVAGEPAEETLWLLGKQGLTTFEEVTTHEPEQLSVAFPAGGYYVIRDGWEQNANYLLIDCGPHGIDNCGHAHADALSIEVAAEGVTQIVDPGTFTYTAVRELRDYFRGSSAHNTVTVDRESSSAPAGPFSWQSMARSTATNWINRERFTYFAGSHDGYSRLQPEVVHSRSILFLKHEFWLMRDQLDSKGPHQYDLTFQFNAGISPEISRLTRAEIATKRLKIATFSDSGEWHSEPGWVSHCYGQRAVAPAFRFSATVPKADFVTFLVPRAAMPGARVREIEAIGGRAFEVDGFGAYDVIVTGDGQRVETARLASDFDFSWAGFAGWETSIPEELVLIGGP